MDTYVQSYSPPVPPGTLVAYHSDWAPGMLGRGADPIVERDAELRRIAELVDQLASDGRGAALVVEGPAGIGKTRLLQAARELGVGRQLGVLSARGTELERGFAFGLARQLLEPPLAAADAEERSELLQGAAALAMPVLGPISTDALAVDAASALHGLYWLVDGLARRRPLLLAVDDAHWADGASLRFFSYLVRRLESLPVLVALGCRPPSGGHDGAVLSELVTDPGAETMRPRPLGSAGVARLLCERLGRSADPEFVDACLAVSGGNPFLLSELARELDVEQIEPRAAEAGRVAGLRPENLARWMMARLVRAGVDAAALAPAIAVLGEGAQLAVAAELVGMPEDTAVDALDALATEGLVAPALPPRFAHPMLRTAAEGLLPPGGRSQLHSRAAELLGQRGASAERVASHLLETEPRRDKAAVETLAEAARMARARGAPDVAARLLRRALEEPPTDNRCLELEFDLGRAERDLGLRSGRAHLAAAADAKNPMLAARATRALVWAGGPDPESLRKVLPLIDRAIERLGNQHRQLALELEALRLAPLWILPDLRERFEGEVERFRQLPGDSAAESLALSFVARALMWRGDSASAVAAAAERAAANPAPLRQDDMAFLWLLYVVNDLLAVDRHELADRLIEQAFELARARGSTYRFATASSLRAVSRLTSGDLQAAEADARAVLRWTNGPMGVAPLVRSLTDQGRTAEAKRLLADLHLDGAIPDTRPMNPLLVERGRLRLTAGQAEAGLADLEEALQRLARQFSFVELAGVEPELERALALRAVGRHDDARREAEGALEAARRWGTNRVVGAALRVKALVAGGEEGLALLREAAALLAESPARLLYARALVDYGAALRRAGRRSEARPPLREGLELADRCVAVPVAETARQELAATGMKVPRRQADPDALTASERRVAELAAEGASNPEIAQHLFVTVKTVEGHLSNTYRKLDIRSRHALRAALDEQGGA
ncbi:MAG: AAA family ATPase [Actinomycetota bacterium]|nr:AAA family ATPase [Actinomycetota bacterium]